MTADPLVIDLAMNAEAARVGELVKAAGWDVGQVEFADIHPCWLVAKDAGEIVGCLQVYFGRPAGRLEYLSIDSNCADQRRVVAALVEQGVATLARGGARAVTSMMVPGDARPNPPLEILDGLTLH